MFNAIAEGFREVFGPKPPGRKVEHSLRKIAAAPYRYGIYLVCTGGQRYLIVADNGECAAALHTGNIAMQEGEWITVSDEFVDFGIHQLVVDGRSYLMTRSVDTFSITALQ